MKSRNTNRVVYTSIGATLAVCLLYVFELTTKNKVPAEVAGAFGSLCSMISGVLISKFAGDAE